MGTAKLPYFERLMVFASMFSFGLLFYRCLFTLSFDYTFYLWNLLIAHIPYIISKQLLKCRNLNLKALILLFFWLISFPACMYIFIDITQMRKTNFPLVYDIFLVTAFAITGLLPGLMSLKKIDTYLKKYIPGFFVKLSVVLFIFLSSYNAGLVKFLHLNSWNIITGFENFF